MIQIWPVLAGGGGAKKNATLRVQNNANPAAQIAVLVDPTAADLAFFANAGAATEANLKARGGRLVNANSRTDFLVTGNAQHQIVVAFVADAAAGPDGVAGTPDDGSITAANSVTSAFKTTGGAGSITTFTVTGAAFSGGGAGAVIAQLLLDLGREFALAGFGLGGLGVIVLAGYALSRKS